MPNKKPAKIDPKILARRFRDRNRRFQKLPIKQQRIKILRDVVFYLETRKFTATPGSYLRLRGYRKAITADDQLHELVERSTCDVCGIGGIFIAAIALKNDFKVSNLTRSLESLSCVNLKAGDVPSDNMRDYLEPWFEKDQLELIEAAFEVDADYAIWQELGETAVDFGSSYVNDKSRFLAICKNMLANDGQFIPKVESPTDARKE